MELRLLIVEDDRLIAEAAADYFTGKGWRVETTEDGVQALEMLEVQSFHLVLLDVMLPNRDGFAVCRQIRKSCDVPIIFITARVLEEDKLNGYSLGADDYVEKPVDMDLLSARVKALLRRSYDMHKESTVLCSGAVSIDQEAQRVFLQGKELALTGKEYELLLLFVKNPGKVLRKEYLFHAVWGADSFSESQTLTVHVKTLRDKIEEDPRKPRRIITVWGTGYKYEEI